MVWMKNGKKFLPNREGKVSEWEIVYFRSFTGNETARKDLYHDDVLNEYLDNLLYHCFLYGE